MTDDLKNKELLSALVDGELYGDELSQAVAWAEEGEGHASWQLYHLVGDVLRSPELAHHSQHDLLSGLRAQLAQEPPLSLQPAALEQLAPAQLPMTSAVQSLVRDPVANASVFRWKMAAGFASVAAVAAMGWNLVVVPARTGSQLAQAPAASQASVQLAQGMPGAPMMSVPQTDGSVIAVATGNGSEVILRDPRLDELLAAHRQFGSKASLQMPADFLRNASFASTPVPAANRH
ncbi:sigma-E factor negative regulatory protein [Comamonas terrigena]|jgi:sigma-E factor negative regulatory protein RseA|uniref:sigma-E factor negative regulatory protein n=1 Tax=Comamonas terrigena TaxID=32013 RepID=UPI00244B6CCE|nr:RseA family anti-sigma factor [Comamonas terrigena]MDH0047669.1 sigma-E factor negative regulatory protein [Comamonas terrigena]MDH0510089.1 sigma-E factor negative regulatory protein [Comamonas terrigena]MDH1089533.1 sigma-E factor negative regulatory protein [Comamonas terrigena]MDH1500800.1 sigma-E factor negative regulatory protein [Comamonas terrigena]